MIYLQLRTWQLGVKSLLLHPLRSLLTVLGIFIGTASVIWLLAIGEGISSKAQEQIAQLGADNIILRSVQPVSNKGSGGRATFALKQYGITAPTTTTSPRSKPSRAPCEFAKPAENANTAIAWEIAASSVAIPSIST